MLTLCWPAYAQAENTGNQGGNSDQPVHIQADRAKLNREKRTSVYTGSVKVDQGRLHLTGNRLVVTQEKGSDSYFTGVMTGEPARLVQDPAKPGQPATYSHAHRIQYDSKTKRLHLQGDAHVRQGGNTLSGESVTYDSRTRRVEANRSKNRQVHITLYPNSPPSTQDSNSPESAPPPGKNRQP